MWRQALPVMVSAICLSTLMAVAVLGTETEPPGDGRTVIDNERGGYYTYPWNDDYPGLGADIGMLYEPYDYDAMNPEAIKGGHGRLQHFGEHDINGQAAFPWPLFLAYEADEVRQGHPGLRPTVTSQGKAQHPICTWHLPFGWVSNPVNLRDDRFIKFWIKQYVRGTLMNPRRENWYVGIDNAAFDLNLYGLPGADGKVTAAGARWDSPFPQTQQEWMDAAKYAFRRLHEWAPDISVIANEASQPDEKQYQDIFRYCTGVIAEEFMSIREEWYRHQIGDFIFDRFAGPDADKVQIFQFSDGGSRLPSGYAAYLVFRGPNGFFGPLSEGPREVDPAPYAAMKNALGHPVAPAHAEQEPGKEKQFQLYWREVDGGLVYLNLTGATKVVDLPAGRKWYDLDGKPITALALKDWEGRFALRESGARCAWPAINPRRGEVTTGPLTITMGTEPWTSGAEIHYTLDGSEPTEHSPRYTGPVELARSCVVKARAVKPGLLPSFVAAAAYTLTDEPPQVGFQLAGDSGSELLDDYPLVALDHPSAHSVLADWAVTGGTAVQSGERYTLRGTLYFSPGERYRHFRLPIVDDALPNGDRTLIITLSNPKHATLGAQRTYTYTILDNDGPPGH